MSSNLPMKQKYFSKTAVYRTLFIIFFMQLWKNFPKQSELANIDAKNYITITTKYPEICLKIELQFFLTFLLHLQDDKKMLHIKRRNQQFIFPQYLLMCSCHHNYICFTIMFQTWPASTLFSGNLIKYMVKPLSYILNIKQ